MYLLLEAPRTTPTICGYLTWICSIYFPSSRDTVGLLAQKWYSSLNLLSSTFSIIYRDLEKEEKAAICGLFKEEIIFNSSFTEQISEGLTKTPALRK